MAVVRVLINGQVPIPVVGAPAPLPPPAPPPPALPPASSSPPLDPALLAAAGVTQAQVDEANAAAAAAAAGMAALLAGGGSQAIATAEQAAGASQSVTDAILAAAIPDITTLQVGGESGAGGAVPGTGEFEPDAGDWPDPEEGDAGLTDDELAALEEEADAYLSGARTLAASTHPAPGTIIGTPYSGSHGKAFNVAGGSDNWQSENAVDIWLYPGTHLLACEAGTISPGGWGYGRSASGGRFAGSRLHIVTASGRVFYYTHCTKLIAARGQKVKKGDLIALSGVANGVPHLHFAVTPPNKPEAWARSTYDASARSPIGKVPPLPGAPVGVVPYRPAGVVAQWRDLVDVFRTDVPKQHARVDSLAKSLVEVFR